MLIRNIAQFEASRLGTSGGLFAHDSDDDEFGPGGVTPSYLKPAVDFEDLRKIREFPVRWMSNHNANLQLGATYEKICQRLGTSVVPHELEFLLGGTLVHARQSWLKGGLTYVTLHNDNGLEIFESYVYAGLRNPKSPRPQAAIHLAPRLLNQDLGDGFRLASTMSSDGKIPFTRSYVQKEYEADGQKIRMEYVVSPHEKDLSFSLQALTPGTQRAAKITHVTIAENSNVEKSSVKVEVILSLSDTALGSKVDRVVFLFDHNGNLQTVGGRSQSVSDNPEWHDLDFLSAIRKGSGVWFNYAASDPKAKLITQMILQKDVVNLHLVRRDTLNNLVAAAREGKTADLLSLLHFTAP
jgi:hypothetical protein